MGIVLGNPWGLLGLLAIPAIILIHFFQRQSRRVIVSTLFLLSKSDEDTRQGRRFKYLRQSLPLWLQILFALLITWVLAEPMFLRSGSAQRVVVMLDSSLSMHAFEDQIEDELRDLSVEVQRNAANTEWILTETDPASGTLYRGNNFSELLDRLDSWTPNLGTHDVTESLRRAVAAAGDSGHAVYLTDAPVNNVTQGLAIRAIGKPIENMGFSGLFIENRDGQLIWRTILRNYGKAEATQTWWIEARGERSEAKPATLAPGSAMTLQGAFPPETDAITLVLEDDEFLPDNRLPILKPVKKKLAIALMGESEQAEKLLAALPDVIMAPSTESADCIFTMVPVIPGELPAKPHIIFRDSVPEDSKIRGGLVVAETHPLTESLNFNGLLLKGGEKFQVSDNAHTLVWKNNHPLIFTERRGSIEDLVFDFSLADSNADRLPSVILLMSRYTASLLENKPGVQSLNFETGQQVSLPDIPPATEVRFIVNSTSGQTDKTIPAGTVRAPSMPSNFELRQNDILLLTGASHLADSRESDFKNAASFSVDLTFANAKDNKNYDSDHFTPLWLMLMAGLMLWSWHATGRRN